MSPIYLDTRDCADLLGVSLQFIRDEIDDGKLHADVIRTGKRRYIKVPIAAFRAYCEERFPSVLPHLPAA